MKDTIAIRSLSPATGRNTCLCVCTFLILSCCFIPRDILGQQTRKSASKTPPADETRAIRQQEVIARLLAVVGELKSESDKPSAALLLSEIADVLWRFDEPTARSVFRLAFDTARQTSTNNTSTLNASEKRESLLLARRRASALKTILKRYGPHDRRGAELWLQEFEEEIKSDQKKHISGFRMSPEQAELLAEMAVGLVSQNPKEAQRLGLLSLSSERMPTAFGRLLMALRDRDKTLSDVLLRQAFASLRTMGVTYDSAMVSMTNYQFSSDGRPFADVSPADVGIAIQYFVEATALQAARLRSGSIRDGDQQSSMASSHSFLSNRALPIVALNAPDQATLMESNLSELAQGLSSDQRRQADLIASLSPRGSRPFGVDDSDLESRIQRAGQEKNQTTRDFMFRNLSIQLMRSEPERALAVARKIDDQETRAQTEDEVFLVLLQKAFATRSYDEALAVALKFNDPNRQARWLTRIAGRMSPGSKDPTEVSSVLSRAHSIAAKSDNTSEKVEVLLQIAKEFIGLDQDRGFEVLADALNAANRMEKTEPKTDASSVPAIRVISVTMVDGQEVAGNERVTLETLDFNQIGAFAEHDFLRTSWLATNLKDRLLRTKYLIALARSVLRVPRQGSGYERNLEDLLAN